MSKSQGNQATVENSVETVENFCEKPCCISHKRDAEEQFSERVRSFTCRLGFLPKKRKRIENVVQEMGWPLGVSWTNVF